jgi:hypothetical protein
MYEVESDLEDKTGHKVRPPTPLRASHYTRWEGVGEGSGGMYTVNVVRRMCFENSKCISNLVVQLFY